MLDDPLLTHAKDLGLTFTLPCFMAQHKYEDLQPTDTHCFIPTCTKASSGHV